MKYCKIYLTISLCILLQNLNNIVTVVATTTNVPQSATIVYSQVMRGVATDSLFTVSSTGAVNAVGLLDRETASSYDIQVQVRLPSHIYNFSPAAIVL